MNHHRMLFSVLMVAVKLFGGPIQTSGQLSEKQSQKLQFSEEYERYFNHELALPNNIESYNESLNVGIPQVQIQATPISEGGWKLVFIFPKTVTFTEEIKNRSLYLTFNQNVDSQDFSQIQEKLSYLLERFVAGYHTLALEARHTVIYKMQAEDTRFILLIVPDEKILQPQVLTLQLAAARLLIEERRYSCAFSVLHELDEKYPRNKDVHLLLANLEGLLPRWQKQYQILEAMHEKYPLDEDITNLMWDTYIPHSSYALIERQLQNTLGLAAVQTNREQYEQIIFRNKNTTLYVGEQGQLWRGHVGQIVNNQGNLVGFKGTRNQATVYMRNEWADGSSLSGSIYGQIGAIGGGMKYGCLWEAIQGDFNISIDWHKPCWEVFEALAYHGREDKILVEIDTTCNRYFTILLGGGSRRVGITGTPNGYISMLARGEIFFNMMITNPIIALNYGLDAEYLLYQKEKTGLEGNPYNPVPYVSFENHSFRLYLYYTWRNHWYLTLFAGETVNRLGTDAPTWGANIKYIPPRLSGVQLELSAYRFPSTTNQGATAEFFTATVTVRF